jgi:site-specific DNA-methyltransferase (adenine-specific)
LEEWWDKGLILKKRDGTPRLDGLKVYLDQMPGKALQSMWTDIPRIPNTSGERLGYPTQKPQALLERIILSSTNEGDIVLDPFCGCGTAIEAAQQLNRTWIGVDITHLAIGLIKYRLQNAFGDGIRSQYEVTGEPVTVQDATQLAQENPFQFQCWALGLVGARTGEQKKGMDRGIDGRLYFHDERAGETKQIVFSVKSGEHLSPTFVRDLRGVLDREKAQIGVLITLHRATREMLKEAASCGFLPFTLGQAS